MKKTLILLITLISFLSVALFVNAQAVTIKPFGPTSWEDLFKSITGVVRNVVGSVAGIMLAVAAIMYLVSAGSPERMKLAKQCLTYAIIGLVIALAAEAIVASIGLITK